MHKNVEKDANYRKNGKVREDIEKWLCRNINALFLFLFLLGKSWLKK